MRSDLSALDIEAQYLQNVISSDASLIEALKSGDSEAAGRIFSTYSSEESSFAAFYSEDGTQFYATEDFPQNAGHSSVSDGLNSDSERMYYCYVTKIDEAGSFIVGYDLRAYDYLDPIREKTGGQFTVFKDNIRYATTIVGDNGNRIEGSQMSAEIAERVLKAGQTYLGRAEIGGSNYVVCYEPMTDRSGKIIGAYFGGYETHFIDGMLPPVGALLRFRGLTVRVPR